MAWDGDALAGQMEEALERQQMVADARAVRGTSTVNERARSAQFESLRASRSRIMTQLSLATNPAYRTVLERGLKSINDQMAEDEVNSKAETKPTDS
jgi:IS5 family transposase